MSKISMTVHKGGPGSGHRGHGGRPGKVGGSSPGGGSGGGGGNADLPMKYNGFNRMDFMGKYPTLVRSQGRGDEKKQVQIRQMDDGTYSVSAYDRSTGNGDLRPLGKADSLDAATKVGNDFLEGKRSANPDYMESLNMYGEKVSAARFDKWLARDDVMKTVKQANKVYYDRVKTGPGKHIGIGDIVVPKVGKLKDVPLSVKGFRLTDVPKVNMPGFEFAGAKVTGLSVETMYSYGGGSGLSMIISQDDLY